MKRAFLVAGIFFVLSACQPLINFRGNVVVKDHINSFIVGKTTMAEILEKCGTPSLHKNNLTWIYIGGKSKEIAFQGVELKNRFVVKMQFDSNKTLTSIERVKLSKNDEILADDDVTELMSEKQAKTKANNAINNRNK
ncbi:MAG: hypothetical protein LBS23_00725 [Holosporaceae bacterium]|nr:hypothetical protein [Holosporaceae bacterium]